MRYYEIITERDNFALIDKLKGMIGHPDTPPDERAAAERALDRILRQKVVAPKTLSDELPDFGEKPRTYTKSGKLSKDHLPDFGKVDTKA